MSGQTTPKTSWQFLAAAGVFLLFAALVLNHAFFFTLDADEAFNATIAKNWLAGYGYSSSLGVIFPFDAYISSGPGYTLVQAIAVSLWGNDPDVQKPFIALVHLLLFAGILWQLRSRLDSDGQWLALVLFCVGSYALVDFKFWHRPAGELLSVLYFVNAALLLETALQQCNRWLALWAGLLAAAALLTKSQALLWLAGLAGAVSCWCWCNRQQWRSQAAVLVLFALALMLPVLGWQLYKNAALAVLASQDPELYRYGAGKDWHFFSTHGSGVYLLWEVEGWPDVWRRLQSTPRLAFGKFSDAFHLYGALSRWYAAAVLLLSVLALFARPRSGERLLFLALPLAAFLLWAYLLNNSVYSHQMLPAIWLWVLLVALWLVRWSSVLWVLAAVNVVLLAYHAYRYDEQACLLTRDAACIHRGENPVRSSLEKTLAYLQSHQLPAPLANCGWYFAQDIEFALPGINHIQDCMRLLDKAVEFDPDAFIAVNRLPEQFRDTRSTGELIDIFVNKRKNLFGGSFVAPVRWRQPVEFTFIAGIYMMGASLEQQRNVMSFLDHCRTVLYKDQFYAIQHCSYEDLQSYVQAWGGLPIFTHSWEAHYYESFMRSTRELRQNPVQMRPY